MFLGAFKYNSDISQIPCRSRPPSSSVIIIGFIITTIVVVGYLVRVLFTGAVVGVSATRLADNDARREEWSQFSKI